MNTNTITSAEVNDGTILVPLKGVPGAIKITVMMLVGVVPSGSELQVRLSASALSQSSGRYVHVGEGPVSQFASLVGRANDMFHMVNQPVPARGRERAIKTGDAPREIIDGLEHRAPEPPGATLAQSARAAHVLDYDVPVAPPTMSSLLHRLKSIVEDLQTEVNRIPSGESRRGYAGGCPPNPREHVVAFSDGTFLGSALERSEGVARCTDARVSDVADADIFTLEHAQRAAKDYAVGTYSIVPLYKYHSQPSSTEGNEQEGQR